MSYSSGSNSVFVNLSTSAQNAKAADTLNSSGVTTINVNYLVKGTNGTGSTASTSITVGTGTSYANTANGLISAINNAGLGMTASFTTQAGAGVTGGGTQTGIQITGGLVSVGIDPNAVSTSGEINPNGIPASELLTQGQTVTVKVGGVTVGAVTISPSVNTLAELAGAINSFAGAPVTATVITNGDGTQSLSLADAASGAGALSVTTSAGAGTQAPVFSTPSTAANALTLAALAGTSVTGVAATTADFGSTTFGIAGTNAGTDVLSAGGSVTLTNTIPGGTQALTFVVGAGTDTATTFFTANHGDHSNTMANLAATINAESATLGAAAVVGTGGITVTASNALSGENVTASANTLTNANATIGLYNPTDGGAATSGTPTITALDAGVGTAQDDVLSTGTHITLTNALGTTTFTAAAGQTYADLALQISNSSLGVTAAFVPNAGNGALVLTSNTTGVNPITVSANNLTDATVAGGPTAVVKDAAFTGVQPGTAGTAGTHGTAILQLATGNLIDTGGGASVLTGQIQIKNGAGATQTFIMGAGTDAGTTYYTGANTVASLVTKINGVAALGITANAPGGGTGGIYLQSNAVGTSITTPGTTTLANAVAFAAPTAVTGVTGATGNNSAVTVGVLGGGLNTGDTLTGSISITNGGITHSFSIGTGVASSTNTVLAAGATLAQLATAISGVTALGLTAQANTTGLTLTSSAPEGTAITVNSSTLADTTQGTYSSVTLGSFASQNDSVSGTINFSVGGSPQIFTLAAGATVASMISQINQSLLGVTASWVAGSNGYGNVILTSNVEGSAGQIATPVTSITDTTATATLSFTTANPYNTGLSNSTSLAALYDSTTGQAQATFVANTTGSNGIATVSYTDGAGQSLSSTDLLNQADAQSALNDLNVAINDVAAMDGYIGAQINILNSISQVMSTQQENVISAQNAIQATDYASATSNMSKYEILSQTGIAALAQANSVEQEVTKLLQ
jgi:flagellin